MRVELKPLLGQSITVEATVSKMSKKRGDCRKGSQNVILLTDIKYCGQYLVDHQRVSLTKHCKNVQENDIVEFVWCVRKYKKKSETISPERDYRLKDLRQVTVKWTVCPVMKLCRAIFNKV